MKQEIVPQGPYLLLLLRKCFIILPLNLAYTEFRGALSKFVEIMCVKCYNDREIKNIEEDRQKPTIKGVMEKRDKKTDKELVLMTEEERDRYFEAIRQRRIEKRLQMQKREHQKKLAALAAAAGIACLVLIGLVAGGVRSALAHKAEAERQEKEAAQEASARDELMAEAELKAAQYDYDGAIKLLKEDSSYEENTEFQDAVKEYEETKASCVAWPLEEITHIFYHTLIKDPSKAFDGDYKEADYNQVMTTIDEFNKITQIMYEKGYVLVSVKDMAKVDEDGTMTPGEILLPPGKIPFVLSQDDVCYYHYMDGDGYASKLIVDEDGKIRNEYVEKDGTVSVGDYDMVPLIDRFVEKHPDFSYKGAKGIVALTGYNGILGYRTDSSYETRPDDLDENKQEWLDAHPDFSLEKERKEAKKVAECFLSSTFP